MRRIDPKSFLRGLDLPGPTCIKGSKSADPSLLSARCAFQALKPRFVQKSFLRGGDILAHLFREEKQDWCSGISVHFSAAYGTKGCH